MRMMILNLMATVQMGSAVQQACWQHRLKETCLLYYRKITHVIFPLLATYIAGFCLAWWAYPQIQQENALMENMQAGALALSCVLMLFCQMRLPAGGSRFVAWSMLLVFTAMLLREVDAERMPLPESVILLVSGTGRNILLGIAFAVTVGVAMSHPRRYFFESLAMMQRNGPWLIVGCLLYVSSWPFDKNVFLLQPETALFFEEVIECGATLCFVAASIERVLMSNVPPASPRQAH